MPIYEYQCGACGHQMDALQKMSDQPLTNCPACKKPALSKKVSAAGFRLSGTGWYETDFKTGTKKNLVADSSTSTSAPSSTSSSTSADKSATNMAAP